MLSRVSAGLFVWSPIVFGLDNGRSTAIERLQQQRAIDMVGQVKSILSQWPCHL